MTFVSIVKSVVGLSHSRSPERLSTLGGAIMYLYLGNNPRVLYLITSSHDERLGRPRRALVFRAGDISSQAVVEFLPKEEIDLANVVRLTSRVVKGCLGLISIENGPSRIRTWANIRGLLFMIFRHIPGARHKCY